jgi:hypothetical protein
MIHVVWPLVVHARMNRMKIIVALIVGLFAGYFFATWQFTHSVHYLNDVGEWRDSGGQCWSASGWDPISCKEK